MMLNSLKNWVNFVFFLFSINMTLIRTSREILPKIFLSFRFLPHNNYFYHNIYNLKNYIVKAVFNNTLHKLACTILIFVYQIHFDITQLGCTIAHIYVRSACTITGLCQQTCIVYERAPLLTKAS